MVKQPKPTARNADDISEDELIALDQGTHADPHTVLGAHADGRQVRLRTRRPGADAVDFVVGSEAIPAVPLGHGIWSALLSAKTIPSYRVHARYVWADADGTAQTSDWDADDPYRYLPTVGELDLHLFARGEHESPWRFLGCRMQSGLAADESRNGAAFSVWAPHAQAVRVVGDFNGWQGAGHMMRRLGSSGVWEIFVPDVDLGVPYKFEILTPAGQWIMKADPYAQFTEVPPHTASLTGSSQFEWHDADWLTAREQTPYHARPVSVYEMHLGSWKLGLGYRQIADELIAYVTRLGFTHVEFMPVMEHPYGGSWGYQVSGYYAPTSRFGHPDDLRYLIDRLHAAGIGVICDWVPAHFPKDAWALADFDGEPLYEYADPRRGEHPDWGTKVFDFGRNEVRNFLIGSALYWLSEFHFDGLRVDAVASMLYLDYSRQPGQWVPNVNGGRENLEAVSLLQHINATAYRLNPGVLMIAEESTSWPGVTHPTDRGGLGFGFKWNMGWMHDSLEYIQVDPMWRADHRDDITRSMLYAYSENFILPISHDEVVHGKGSLAAKMPGDEWHRLANVRAYLAFMWAHPGKKLLFMGQEFAQGTEWSEAKGLDWYVLDYAPHQGVAQLVADLGAAYASAAPLWELDNDPGGFTWLESGDRNIVAFARWDRSGTPLVSVSNFAGDTRTVAVPLPRAGTWFEVLNTDSDHYGGSGSGNLGKIDAWADDERATAMIVVPALSTLWFAQQ